MRAVLCRVVSVLLMFSAVSCVGIMEERDGCPCNLVLSLEGAGKMVVDVCSADGTFHVSDTVQAGEHVVAVPRSELYLNVYQGDEGCFSSGVRIPSGRQCPPLSLYSRHFLCRGDELCETVSLHKSYCTVELLLTGGGEGLRLSLRGYACGYLLDGGILRGPFSYICGEATAAPARTAARVPRQFDSSLMLEVETEDTLRRSFALGEYITESGYDWEAADLEDITVEVDYSVSSLTFRISSWERTVPLQVRL